MFMPFLSTSVPSVSDRCVRRMSITSESPSGFQLWKFLVVALLAATAGMAGCAPGVSGRSGPVQRPPAPQPAAAPPPAPEVIVVEAKPEPSPAVEIRSHRREIAQLREELDANRTRIEAANTRANTATERADAAAARATLATERADAATARAVALAQEAQAAQEAILALQAELAEVKVRSDAASAQAGRALDIATEFLSNLVAAREEQRSLIARNLTTFDAMENRLNAIEGRITETRKQRDADLAAAGVLSTDTQLKLRQADQELTQLREQLAELNRKNEETRAVVDSGAMLGMLRQLEATRRDTAVLRGALEEMQREQEEARKRVQNYYLDLDARIQTLQERDREARKAGTGGLDADDAASSGSPADLTDEGVPDVMTVPGAIDNMTGPGANESQFNQVEPLPRLEIVPYVLPPQDATGAGQTGSPQDASGTNDSLLDEAADLIDAARDSAEINTARLLSSSVSDLPAGSQPASSADDPSVISASTARSTTAGRQD